MKTLLSPLAALVLFALSSTPGVALADHYRRRVYVRHHPAPPVRTVTVHRHPAPPPPVVTVQPRYPAPPVATVYTGSTYVPYPLVATPPYPVVAPPPPPPPVPIVQSVVQPYAVHVHGHDCDHGDSFDAAEGASDLSMRLRRQRERILRYRSQGRIHWSEADQLLAENAQLQATLGHGMRDGYFSPGEYRHLDAALDAAAARIRDAVDRYRYYD